MPVSRRRRIVLALLALLAVGLVSAAAALASAFNQVYDAYRNSGRIAPCRFSEHVLQQAKAQVPPDIVQYAPDFPAALDAALHARAAGACGGAGTAATPASTPAASATAGVAAGPGAAPPGGGASAAAPSASGASSAATPAPVLAASTAPAGLAVPRRAGRGGGGGTPAALIALAVLAGLLALGTGLWGLARWRGWDPPWVRYLSHAVSEAGVQAEATWAEFTDWVRLGR